MSEGPLIDVCISTLNSGLLNLVGKLPRAQAVRYLIGHQFSDENERDGIVGEWNRYSAQRPDINLVALDTIGLSRNRNALIEYASADVIMFADDDVEFFEGFDKTILRAHNEHEQSCMIVFPFLSKNITKKRADECYTHGFLSAARISSIEITVKLNRLKRTGVRFDERFGLGAEYPSGEEYIFATDLMKQGQTVINYPAAVVRHDHDSSGPGYFLSTTKLAAKGAMLKRIFRPPLSWLMIVLFSLKKYPVYRNQTGLLRHLGVMLKASLRT